MTDYFKGDPRTNRERMLAGDFYVADDPESAREVQRAVRLAAEYYDAFAVDAERAQPILAQLIGAWTGRADHRKGVTNVQNDGGT